MRGNHYNREGARAIQAREGLTMNKRIREVIGGILATFLIIVGWSLPGIIGEAGPILLDLFIVAAILVVAIRVLKSL